MNHSIALYKSTFSQAFNNKSRSQVYIIMERERKKFDFRFALHCNILQENRPCQNKYMDTLINLFETIDIINSRLGMKYCAVCT